MNTVLKILVLGVALTASAQTPITELRATAEHTLTGITPESAKRLALADAARKVMQEATTRLQNTPEVQALQLKPDQLEAYIDAMLDPQEQPVRTAAAAEQTYRADVFVRLDPGDLVRRFRMLHKDQDATLALVELWNRSQQLHRQLAESSSGSNKTEQQLILTTLQVKHLAAQVQVALAKTEQGSASALHPSKEGQTRARQLAEAALALSQDLPDAHYAMGDVLTDSGEAQPAEAEYRKALLADANSSSGHTRLAYVLRLQQKFPDAVTELREALRIDPNSVTAHTDLGIVLAAQNNATEAISEYQQALRLDPDFIEAHNNLAIALSRQRRIPAAVAEFREIVRIDPDSALGYFNMATALADMEKDAESAEALREVVRINPNHYNAHYNLGELFRLETKYDEAVKQFKEYLRLAESQHLAPDTPQTQRNIKRAKEFIQTHDNP